MGLFRAPEPIRKPQKHSRLSLAIFLLVVYVAVKLLGSPAPLTFHPDFLHFSTPLKIRSKADLLIAIYPGLNDSYGLPRNYDFSGWRIRRSGTYVDLGDKRTRLPASLLSRFFPAELIVPSCLTQQVPAADPAAARPLPVRDDWPGFYGAPWTARLNGNLIALLHVQAPRKGAATVASPDFQIYAAYHGQATPDFDVPAPADFERGSKAVLYRVFPNGPIRCLDLVVQNGENYGIGHLYYQKYHHYYEMDTIFQVQP